MSVHIINCNYDNWAVYTSLMFKICDIEFITSMYYTCVGTCILFYLWLKNQSECLEIKVWRQVGKKSVF